MSDDAEARAVPPAFDPAVCWTCGGAADPAYENGLLLQGDRIREGVARLGARDSLGCEVVLRGSTEYVAVSIPRCRACRTGARARNAAGALATVPSIAVGVGFGAALNRLSGGDWDSLPSSQTLPSLLAVGLGMTVGWIGGFYLILTVACLALGATRKRPKPDKTFPLVAALLARGWRFQATD